MSNNPLLNSLVESYEVDMYDMSIEDVEERAKKKVRFKTAMNAGAFLGIPPHKIYERIGRGKYAYHAGNGNKYALRKVKA